MSTPARPKVRRPFAYMHAVAFQLSALLEAHCIRIAIAGSVRRRKEQVTDIELVAIPIPDRDLYGETLEPCGSLNRYLAEAPVELEKNGPKYKRFLFSEARYPGQPIACDLFLTTEPQWGYIYMLRTGSAEFSQKMVTPRMLGGYMPDHLKVQGGFVWQGDDMIPVPREEDLFDLWQMDFVPPEERN